MKLDLYAFSLFSFVLSYSIYSSSVVAAPVGRLNSYSSTGTHIVPFGDSYLFKRVGVLERLGLKKPQTPQQVADKLHKMKYKHQVMIDRLENQHRMAVIEIEKGGKHNVQMKWTGSVINEKYRNIAMDKSKLYWENNKGVQIYPQASVTANCELFEGKKKTTIQTRFYNGNPIKGVTAFIFNYQ